MGGGIGPDNYKQELRIAKKKKPNQLIYTLQSSEPQLCLRLMWQDAWPSILICK